MDRNGNSEPGVPDDDLIRYWEGIASALQVSVKTAQRYEKEFGLPIRRKKGSKGTIIYASRRELNAWAGSDQHPAGDDPAATSGNRRFGRSSLLWLAAIAILIVAGFQTSRMLTPREPVSWKIDHQRLSALDSRDRLVWSHEFAFALQPSSYHAQGGSLVQPDIGQFVDLDNNGHKELLFLAVSTDEYKRAFYCFNADGTVRFSVVPGRTITHTVRFGDHDFSPPFGVLQFFAMDDASTQKKNVFVISYDPTWFPAVVQKYSASGRLLGEYWSPGRLYTLLRAQFGSKQYLFVGGTNNEFHGGSLAILDWDNPWGSSPATNPHYRCMDCRSGGPLAFFVFPEMDVSKVLRAWPTAWLMHQDTSDRVCAQVLQTREPLSSGGPAGLAGSAIYCIDSQLQLRTADIVEGYRVIHGALEAQGLLNHQVGVLDERELLPVLQWNSTSFVRISHLP